MSLVVTMIGVLVTSRGIEIDLVPEMGWNAWSRSHGSSTLVHDDCRWNS